MTLTLIEILFSLAPEFLEEAWSRLKNFKLGRMRRFFSGLACFALFAWLATAASPPHAAPQGQPLPNPLQSINEECTAFAFAPDGRIVFSVRRVFPKHKVLMQRDDIWMASAASKKRRIVDGEKLITGPDDFSYTVRALRWSPDGTRLTAELETRTMVNDQGETREGVAALLLDDGGREIKISGGDSIIPNAENAAWLDDGATVVYLLEAIKPRLLFTINTVRPVAGRGGPLVANAFYSAAAWDAQRHMGVGIELDELLAYAPKVVLLDLIKQVRRVLVEIEGFAGGLTISPSGEKMAYFRDGEILEIREISKPEKATRVRVPFGNYQWSRDERRILIKRGPERRSDSLVWVRLADSDFAPILHELTFRDFMISPDGRRVGVMIPGKGNIVVYPLE